MRIVSLCPSLTELVFELGRGAELVGRTKFCIHPADRVGAVEKVGGTKNPKVDRIIELAPDIVLLNEEENRREDAEALESSGIRCHVSFPRNAADTANITLSTSTAAGTAILVKVEATWSVVGVRPIGFINANKVVKGQTTMRKEG